MFNEHLLCAVCYTGRKNNGLNNCFESICDSRKGSRTDSHYIYMRFTIYIVNIYIYIYRKKELLISGKELLIRGASR